MFEELLNLLCHLGLGPAAKPVCDLIVQLAGETMTLQQLQQEIRDVLAHHGRTHLTGTVVSALVELGLAGYAPGAEVESNEDAGAAAATRGVRPGCSPISDSVLLTDTGNAISINPQAVKAHNIARGWLDIDGGIYFDVRQHGAGSDSEK